jgi:HAD superfamily hydrolase (TIGR01509 family)
MGNIDNLIFDLDGTLTEFNLPFDKIRDRLRIKERFVLESILKSSPKERERKFEVLKRFEIDAAKNSKLIPGVKEIIEFIESKNIKKGVVTRNCKESVEIFSRKFRIDFDYIISRERVTPKPSPLPVVLAILLAKSRPENSLVVGDFKFDLISGKLAGVKTVLLKTEKNSEMIDEFIPLADYVIEDIRELKRLI